MFACVFICVYRQKQWVCCRGLEQQVALPKDSYLQDYFSDLYGVLRVGPPLYFVVPDIRMDPQDPDINAICSVGGCNDTSFVNQVCLWALHLHSVRLMHSLNSSAAP